MHVRNPWWLYIMYVALMPVVWFVHGRHAWRQLPVFDKVLWVVAVTVGVYELYVIGSWSIMIASWYY